MKSKLFVLAGIPASGKTTYAKAETAKANAAGIPTVHISRDEVRLRVLKDKKITFEPRQEYEVRQAFYAEVKAALKNGMNVYADATHLNPGSRKGLWNAIKDDAEEVEFVFFSASPKICIPRNAKRVGIEHVPDSVIRGMWRSVVLPTQDECPVPIKVTKV